MVVGGKQRREGRGFPFESSRKVTRGERVNKEETRALSPQARRPMRVPAEIQLLAFRCSSFLQQSYTSRSAQAV